MMIFTGGTLLTGGLAALVLSAIHDSSSLVSTMLFLVTMTGGMVLVCGIRNRKGMTPFMQWYHTDIVTAQNMIRTARKLADAGEISEEEYEGRVRELRRRFMPEEDEKTEKGN